MDAEIRRLTYVQRLPAAMVLNPGTPEKAAAHGLSSLAAREGAAFLNSRPESLRLEARLIEMETERAETERRHREQVAALEQRMSEEREHALQEQRNTLEYEWAEPVENALKSFRHAQSQYFAEAETLVVRLALAIAERVLHREAQLDPLVLRGTVRVALDDAQKGVVCELEVASERGAVWRRWLADQPIAASVEIREKDGVALNHCRLTIGKSTADVSINAQLVEIERGFFDLLRRRGPSHDEAER